ncbi:unnamed protein product [Tilletia controversa]|nr:unnamed protein product [Tilletia controversa]
MPAETVVAATKSRYQWASDPDVKAHHPSRRERIHPFGLSTALPHLAQHPSPSHDVTTTAPPLKSLRSRHPTETSARHTLPPRLALHTSSREDSPSMPHNPCATGYSDFLSNVSKLKIIETVVGINPARSLLLSHPTPSRFTNDRIPATTDRLQSPSSMDIETIQRVQEEIYICSPFASFLRSASDTLSAAEREGNDTAIRIIDPGRIGETDPRTYNRPTASEVAVLIVHDVHNTSHGRDPIFYYKEGPLRCVSELHPAFLPLRFPLLISYGHFGWYPYIPLGKGTPRAIFDPDQNVARAALSMPRVAESRGRGGTHKVTLEMFHAFH